MVREKSFRSPVRKPTDRKHLYTKRGKPYFSQMQHNTQSSKYTAHTTLYQKKQNKIGKASPL
uniref:Uncharacterized protein n=1 Tax=Anguilla anguilla TaxID=7936 RepID=A0A0E9X2U2_ANGAN